MPHAHNRQGQRVFYEVFGASGPYVVMLMGIGVSGRYWLSIPQELARDRDHPHRVIVIDNRGTGRSDRPRAPWTMASMGDDVAAVLDHAGVEQAMLVGISMGGMIAQQVAIRHPKRVSALLLLSTMPGLPLGTLPPPQAVRTLVRGFSNNLGGSDFLRLMYPESQLERVRELLRKGPLRELSRSERFEMRTVLYHLLAVATHSTGHLLDLIRCPTLVLTGAEDVLMPPANSHFMVKRIPHARLKVLPDVGHDVLTLAPECISESLRALRTV